MADKGLGASESQNPLKAPAAQIVDVTPVQSTPDHYLGIHELVGIPSIPLSVQPSVTTQSSRPFASIVENTVSIGKGFGASERQNPLNNELPPPALVGQAVAAEPNIIAAQRRGRSLVQRYSLPVFPQHRHELKPAKVSFKGKMQTLEGPTSPFPMTDVASALPGIEVPRPSNSLEVAAQIIADKIKAQVASTERMPKKLSKIGRSRTYIQNLEMATALFEEEEEEDDGEAEVEEDAEVEQNE